MVLSAKVVVLVFTSATETHYNVDTKEPFGFSY